jgi:hypothetical protein
MTVKLLAPFIAPMTQTTIKSPELQDQMIPDIISNDRRSMNGTRYSYVNSSDYVRLIWTWDSVDKGKVFEIEEFVYSYFGEEIKIVDWRGTLWRARLLTSPADFEISKRAAPCPPGRNEAGTFTLEFLAIRLTGRIFDECDPAELAFNSVAIGQSATLTWEEAIALGVVVGQQGEFAAVFNRGGAGAANVGQQVVKQAIFNRGDGPGEPGRVVTISHEAIGVLGPFNNQIFRKLPLEENLLANQAWQPEFKGANINMQAAFMGANELELKPMPVIGWQPAFDRININMQAAFMGANDLELKVLPIGV